MDWAAASLSRPARVGAVVGSLQLELIIFDDGIAQKLMTGLIDLSAHGLTVARHLDFKILPHMDGLDALVPHVFESFLDSLSLRIDDRFFGCNNDFGFHLARCPAAAML